MNLEGYLILSVRCIAKSGERKKYVFVAVAILALNRFCYRYDSRCKQSVADPVILGMIRG